MSDGRTVRIRATGLGLEAAGRRILAGVDLDVSVRRLAVIGANGSGKTSFARLLTGLAAATEGALEVAGLDARRDAAALRRAGGFLFSNPDVQIVMPTVAEDVAFTLTARGVSRRAAAPRVDAVLDGLGLAHLRDASAHTLSGGEKQLLAVAAVLVAEPRFVVADEPTAYLDGANARRIAHLLLGDRDGTGTRPPVVLVTHDLALARRCDLAVRFEGGRIVDSGAPTTVVAAYEALLDAAADA